MTPTQSAIPQYDLGYWIAQHAVKTLVDNLDNYNACDLDITFLEQLVRTFFGVCPPSSFTAIFFIQII